MSETMEKDWICHGRKPFKPMTGQWWKNTAVTPILNSNGEKAIV